MSTLLVYLHLFVLWLIGSRLMQEEAPLLLRMSGALILIIAVASAFCYAVCNLWEVWMK